MRIWKWAAPSMALGASLLVGSFFGSATPVAASTSESEDDVVEDGVVECGTEFSVRPVIDPCFLELQRWRDAPPGSHDEEIADLLANQAALFKLLVEALIEEASASGQLYDWSCAACDVPGACRTWITGWSPAPEVQFFVSEDGSDLVLEAELTVSVTLTVSCTDC